MNIMCSSCSEKVLKVGAQYKIKLLFGFFDGLLTHIHLHVFVSKSVCSTVLSWEYFFSPDDKFLLERNNPKTIKGSYWIKICSIFVCNAMSIGTLKEEEMRISLIDATLFETGFMVCYSSLSSYAENIFLPERKLMRLIVSIIWDRKMTISVHELVYWMMMVMVIQVMRLALMMSTI